MNENLLRDFHEAQMEEITAVKNKIEQLATKETVSQADIAKLQMMITSIRIPEVDFSELRQLSNFIQKSSAETTKSVTRSSENLCHAIEVARKPTIKRIEHIFDFKNLWGIGQLLISIVIIGSLSGYAIAQNKQHKDAIIGDLKYRYVKMSYESSKFIHELESAIQNDPKGENLRFLRSTVEDYEEAIRKRIAAEELARHQKQRAAAAEAEAERIRNEM